MKLALKVIVAASTLCTVGSAAAAPLKSPWDARPVAGNSGSYSCPTVAVLPKDVVAADFYSDAKHSVIDPKREAAYREAQAVFEETEKATEKAADTFVATGNKGAAGCVLTLLAADAAAQSMTGSMSTNQANYVQNWTLGALAVTWLKVRSADPGTPEQRRAVTAWLDTVGGQVRTYFTARHDKNTKDGTNNHYYWAGFAAVAAAVAANDRGLYDWGMSTYADAVARITPEGTLPLEMERGQRALHYHLFALAPIVMLAEFGEANGVRTYAMGDGAVHKLVKRTVAGLVDNSFFSKAAGTAQDTPDKKEPVKSNDVVELVPYLQRFPDAAALRIVKSANLHADAYLGGLPPGWPLQ